MTYTHVGLNVLDASSSVEQNFLGSIAQGANAIGSLGILGALITIAVTYLRDRRKTARNLRSELSAEIIEAVAEKLTSRSNPGLDSGGVMADGARLFVSATKLRFEMSGRRDQAIKKYVDDIVAKVNYGQPVPRTEGTLSDLTMKLSTWSRSPRKVRRELPR